MNGSGTGGRKDRGQDEADGRVVAAAQFGGEAVVASVGTRASKHRATVPSNQHEEQTVPGDG